jgi:hypothetical protein
MSKDDDATATKVHELLRSGRLPAHPPTRVWAGYGSGSDRCALCTALVPTDQVVMEAVFGLDDANSLFFHRECFYLVAAEWRAPRHGASWAVGSVSASGAGSGDEPAEAEEGSG